MVKQLIILICITVNIYSLESIESRYWMNSTNSSSLGLAITAQTNHPDALFFNPGSLHTNKKSNVNIQSSNIYNTDFFTLSAIGKINKITVGVGSHMTQSGNIEKTTYNEDTNTIISNGTYNYGYYNLYLGAGTTFPFIKWGSIGTSLNFHEMNIDSDSLKGFTINIGTIFEPVSFLSIGYRYNLPLVMTWYSQDKINKRQLSESHKINSQSAIGVQLTSPSIIGLKIQLLGDYLLNKPTNDLDTQFRLGSKLSFKRFDVNLGHNSRSNSAGIDLKFNRIKFGYSLTLPNQSNDLSNRHGFGINYLF